MPMGTDQNTVHQDLTNIGLRAQATAAGLVQLCKELQRAGVIDEKAVQRVKDAIADEIALTAPRPIPRADYRRDVCQRLDLIFSGEQEVGDAEGLAFRPGHSK